MFLGTTILLWITVFSYEALFNLLLKIFVHLSVIATVCYFSVYKLIGWDPANVYLFKVNSRTLEEGVNFLYFNCYLAAPWSTSGYSQRDSLTNPMLSLHFDYFEPKVSQSLAERLVGSEPGTFRF